VFLFDGNIRTAFPSGELHSFLDFKSGLTEVVRITGSKMLQRRKYDQSLVMYLLFADVAHS
jgi:hypothetical protein